MERTPVLNYKVQMRGGLFFERTENPTEPTETETILALLLALV